MSSVQNDETPHFIMLLHFPVFSAVCEEQRFIGSDQINFISKQLASLALPGHSRFDVALNFLASLLWLRSVFSFLDQKVQRQTHSPGRKFALL